MDEITITDKHPNPSYDQAKHDVKIELREREAKIAE